MSYLEIKGVDKAYGVHGPKVIENLNLTIEQGEFMVFLGPSGCGKTTIIRMIAGLEEVSKGDIVSMECRSWINCPRTGVSP